MLDADLTLVWGLIDFFNLLNLKTSLMTSRMVEKLWKSPWSSHRSYRTSSCLENPSKMIFALVALSFVYGPFERAILTICGVQSFEIPKQRTVWAFWRVPKEDWMRHAQLGVLVTSHQYKLVITFKGLYTTDKWLWY